MIFPLKSIYIHDQGITLAQIGTLATAGAIAFSVGGLAISNLSDRLGKRRGLIILLLISSAAVLLAYLGAETYFQFLVLSVLDMGMLGGYIILIDASVSTILPPGGRGGGFGWYRISGSIGFALAALSLGLVTTTFGIASIFVIGAGALLLASTATAFMVEAPPQPDDPVLEIHRPRYRFHIVKILLASGLAWFVAADLITMFGAQIAFPYQNIYIHDVLGATAGQIGRIATIGVLAEIPSMLLLGNLSDRVGRGPVLMIGFLAGSFSWLLIFIAQDLLLVYLAVVLNGVAFVRYSVGVALITDRAPENQRATLMSLSNINFGLGGIFGPMIGAAIVARLQIRAVFLVAFCVNALGSLVYLVQVVRERQHQARAASSSLSERG